MPDDEFESQIFRFEQAWQRDGLCEIADFLNLPSALEAPARQRLLVELICVDLEFRWRDTAGDRRPYERITLEDYAAKFPELGAPDQFPLELIGEEYRVRCGCGTQPTHDEFLARFTSRQDQVRDLLLQIDREIAEDAAADLPQISQPAVSASAQRDLSLHGPLLSHHDFLLERMIGAGQMGKVYRAWQHSERRLVAVKFLRKSLLHQPGVVERFIGEARTIAMLRHPNIVGIHGLGRTSGGAYFIVMDFVAGSNLAYLGSTRSITVEEAIRWTIDTCDALEHAHARGIIHCDLKPANLLLDECGRIRVTDFGLARSLTEDTPWTAEVEGTAPFMAPEQAARCWGPIATQTDVYGIGAVLFTLLTGRPPWIGRRLPDILAQVVSAAPAVSAASLRSDLPKLVSDLCRKCLSKAPEDRYRTVQDLRSVLTALHGTC